MHKMHQMRVVLTTDCPWLSQDSGVNWAILHKHLAIVDLQICLTVMNKEARYGGIYTFHDFKHHMQRYFSKKHEYRDATLHMLNTNDDGELLMKIHFYGASGAGTWLPVAGKGKPFQTFIHELRFLAGASLPVHFTRLTESMASIIKWPNNTSGLYSTSLPFREVLFTWDKRVVQDATWCFTEWVGANTGEKGTDVTYVLDNKSHCVFAILPGEDHMLANVGTWRKDERSPTTIKEDYTVIVWWHLRRSAPICITPQPYSLPSIATTNSSADDTMCGICFQADFDEPARVAGTMPCKHWVCQPCLNEWIRFGGRSCPFCRTAFDND